MISEKVNNFKQEKQNCGILFLLKKFVEFEFTISIPYLRTAIGEIEIFSFFFYV